MTRANALWEFTNAVSTARATTLNNWESFDGIIGALNLLSSVENFWWEPFLRPELKGCNRASFLIKVPRAIYDAFFNSPNGYRGQYACAPTTGETANRRLLTSLEPKLLSAALAQDQVKREGIVASLRGSDAKIWIDEAEVEDQLCDEPPGISYAPWEFNWPDGMGLRTPVGTLLEVKGGWLDPNGVERRDPIKAPRSLHIFERGYS
jgi:hypothetical protein